MSEFAGEKQWYEKVDVGGLSNNVRRAILQKVKEKLGFNKTMVLLEFRKGLYTTTLKGKELSEKLLDYVINHSNRWLRNVFRQQA